MKKNSKMHSSSWKLSRTIKKYVRKEFLRSNKITKSLPKIKEKNESLLLKDKFSFTKTKSCWKSVKSIKITEACWKEWKMLTNCSSMDWKKFKTSTKTTFKFLRKYSRNTTKLNTSALPPEFKPFQHKHSNKSTPRYFCSLT